MSTHESACEIDDASLLRQGVEFLPWVGAHYKQGFRGRRLLVLGESHYDKWRGKGHRLGNRPTFTRECILGVIEREQKAAKFWRTLEQCLLNEKLHQHWALNGAALWHKIAFYNFLQSPVPGQARARRNPQLHLKVVKESVKPFRAVLESLRPDRVLVCGMGLWNKDMEEIPDADKLHKFVQAYRLNDRTRVWCLATVHPSSSRYSWSKLHPVITAFLNDPKKAVASLPEKKR